MSNAFITSLCKSMGDDTLKHYIKTKRRHLADIEHRQRVVLEILNELEREAEKRGIKS